MKKSLSILSALFLIGLFVVATAPVRAGTTEERIKAMEEELARLKAEQQNVKEDQNQIKRDALAARAAAPRIRYRPGRGLSIQGADKSWEIRFRQQMQWQTSFFLDSDTKSTEADQVGPSQGTSQLRHMEGGWYTLFYDGLYEMGYTDDETRGGGSKRDVMAVNFQKWSPYYPQVRFNSLSPNGYSPLTRASSSGGHTVERSPIFDGQFTTGSATGHGLVWKNLPLPGMPGNIRSFDIAYTSENHAIDSDFSSDPDDVGGVSTGIVVDPFSKTKGFLKGLRVGFAFVNDHMNDTRTTDIEIKTRHRASRVTLFDAGMRGRRHYYNPWATWTYGPLFTGFSYDVTDARRDFTGDLSAGRQRNAVLTSANATVGLFLWGPKGFLSGSRKKGWRLSYTWARSDFDIPRDSTGSVVRSDFSGMSRWHHIENIVLLRWFVRPNINFYVEGQHNTINKMVGSNTDAVQTRRAYGIPESSSNSGDINILMFGSVWIF